MYAVLDAWIKVILSLRENHCGDETFIHPSSRFAVISNMAISDAINRMMIRTVSVGAEDYMRPQPHRRTSFTHHVRVRLAETTDSSDLSLSGTVNNTNDSEYFTDDGTGGDGSFTAGTIVSLLLCVLIIVIFLWLGYCACWFSYGG